MTEQELMRLVSSLGFRKPFFGKTGNCYYTGGETGMGVVASSGELHGATRKQIREAIREIAAGITEKITEHYEEIVDRVNADRGKFEDRIMRQVSGVVEENFGKTSFQVVYSGKDGKSPGTKITPEQEKKARELLRKGVSREKIIEEIFA